MKLINHFLILFLIISITSENLIDYFSINLFINDLKRNGLFEIILSIKKVYGQDVAIISCEELNENRKGNCKRIVTEYMDPSKPPEPQPEYLASSEPSENPESRDFPQDDVFDITEDDKSDDQNPGDAGDLNSDQKSRIPSLDLILSKKFNSEKSKLISNKIKKKIKTKNLL